jgi:hypothetical protein
MSKLQHTSGPWFYDHNVSQIYSQGGNGRYNDIPENYMANEWNNVCCVDDFFNYKTREYLYERQKANARLIAAAPEMLEALIEFLKFNGAQNTEEYQLKVLKLIEKATGLSIEEILK